YSLRLIVDGRAHDAPLILAQDPRTRTSDANFQASLDLSRQIAAALELAWRGHGQMAAAHAVLVATEPGPPDAQRAALAQATAPPKSTKGFDDAGAVLAGVETDLEAADLPPTQPQREAVAKARAQVDAAWAVWSRVRDQDLPAYNAARRLRGATSVVIPPDDQLSAEPPAGGEALP
ncbi:MAG: hypothetical protein ABI056_04570, partial [Caulobacteraceae bacterium]